MCPRDLRVFCLWWCVAAVPPLRRLAALPLLAFAALEFGLSSLPLLLAPACRPACCRVRPLPSLSLFRSFPVAGPVVLSVCLVPVCWSSSSGLPPDTARPRPDGSRWERRPRVNCGRKSRRGVTGRGRWSAAASSPPHLLHTHQHGSTRRLKQSCTA